MKTNWKAIGITAVSVALLYYPAMKLYQYITKKMADAAKDKNDNTEHHIMKAFIPSFRGKHKAAHRHSGNNGHGQV